MSANSADVTIRDVASLAGVSPMTVSRVINESDRVSPDTQRRVEKAIAELGYIPSRLARGLSARRTGTLAVIVPDVANPFFTMVVRAAEDVARRSAYRVILCDTRADLAVERDVIEELIAHRVEGIAIAPVSDRSKPHKLSHIVLNSAKIDEQTSFFIDLLGFKHSDSTVMMDFTRFGRALATVQPMLPPIECVNRMTGVPIASSSATPAS